MLSQPLAAVDATDRSFDGLVANVASWAGRSAVRQSGFAGASPISRVIRLTSRLGFVLVLLTGKMLVLGLIHHDTKANHFTFSPLPVTCQPTFTAPPANTRR